MAAVPWSVRFPWLRPVAVRAHQARRWLAWQRPGTAWARDRSDEDLSEAVFAHSSPLRRAYPGVDAALQDGKAHNLRLASARLDGSLIAPGEAWSFHRTVGDCSRRRGYVDGLRLEAGAAAAGVGGGICALSNLVHWLALHSDLTVLERSEHSVDPFPDLERTVPWGVGCTVVYNYVDLVLRNDTDRVYQLRAGVTDEHLVGELRSSAPQPASYAVEAREERFETVGATTYRSNEIWRVRASDGVAAEELVRRNRARVAYPVARSADDSTPRSGE